MNVRIVAATNRNLEKEVEAGRFREDLSLPDSKVFLNQVPVAWASGARTFPLLAGYFLARYSTELGKPAAGFAQQAMELLQVATTGRGTCASCSNEGAAARDPDRGGGLRDAGSPVAADPGRIEGVIERVPGPTKGTLKEMMDQLERWLLIDGVCASTRCEQQDRVREGARDHAAKGSTRSCARTGW